MTIHEATIAKIRQMSEPQVREVQDFVDFLMTRADRAKRGMSGQSLLAFGGTIEAADLAVMTAAVEEDCERVDPHGW